MRLHHVNLIFVFYKDQIFGLSKGYFAKLAKRHLICLRIAYYNVLLKLGCP